MRDDVRRSWITSVKVAAGDIKLSHSIFALPFAVLGATLAMPRSITPAGIVWRLSLVALCMVLARTWAMLINRLVDRRLDAGNPRTSRRALVSGRLDARRAWTMALFSAGAFWACAGLFWVFWDNPWPAILTPPVLVWIAFYSLTKRFTWLCHVFLGGALAASPLAAAIAVNPHSLSDTPAIWWLSAMVLFWVAGFDVIYALQDVRYDRSAGLHSAPSDLGTRPALWLSRLGHAVALGALALAWFSDRRFGPIFALAVLLVGGLLIAEHAILARRGRRGLQTAFFTLNGVISVVLGTLGMIDLIA